MEFIQALIGSLGPGAIYAIAGLGIVVGYRVSGVVNFSQGAVAMATAYLFWDLHDMHAVPLLVAIFISLAFSAVVGLLTHMVLYRMKDAAPAQKIVATLGILIVLQWAVILLYGTNPEIMQPILSQRVFHVGQIPVGVDRLTLLGLAIVMTLGLYAFYQFSPFGKATSVVTESELLAASCGYSPGRVAAVNFAIGGVLGGAAGILVAPIVGLDPDSLTYLIVPILAAAVVGGFRSFTLTAVGALVIGVSQIEGDTFITQPGVGDSIPFVIIIAILIARGQALPGREFIRRRLPKIGRGNIRPRQVLMLTAAGIIVLRYCLPDEWVVGLSISFAYAIVCISVVILTGYTGQISLVQYTLAGVGAFIAGRLVASHVMPFTPAAILAVLAAILIGFAIGLPALRTRGISLAVATLGLGFVIDAVVFENYGWTGGAVGTTVQQPTIFGWNIDALAHTDRYAIVCFLGLVACSIIALNLRRGVIGRRLVAVRENERAASALGISVGGTKLYVFGIGAGIAAFGGIFIAFQNDTIDFTTFPPIQSILLVGATALGGLGFVWGAIIGGLALAPAGLGSVVGQHIGGIQNYLPLIGGIALLEVLLVHPNGIASDLSRLALKAEGALRIRAGRIWPGPVRAARKAREPKARESAYQSQAEVDGPMARPLELSIKNLTVKFGGVTAVADANLSVRPGEVVGLIGPNGAGKTTLIDAATGFTDFSSGEIWLGGNRIDRKSVMRRARAGLSRSFQSLELFEEMTIEENIRVACEETRHRSYFTELFRPTHPSLTPAAWAALREFDLLSDLSSWPHQVPYSRRRLVAIARAVASLPSILMLDEPAGGLDEHERRELGTLVRRLADEWKIGVLIVEHDIELIMEICDRVSVLQFGKVIASGSPEEIRSNPSVIAAYIGGPDEPKAEDVPL